MKRLGKPILSGALLRDWPAGKNPTQGSQNVIDKNLPCMMREKHRQGYNTKAFLEPCPFYKLRPAS